MYSTKELTEKSYDKVIYLLQQTFGLKKSVESITIKYDTNIFGKFTIGFIAEDEKEVPAAYYGVFPTRLDYQGKDFLVAQSGETMTAPLHQKKGLFTQLAKETYEKSKLEGIALIFGFPNENSTPGFKSKLNWVFNGHMQKITLKIKTIPLCELATKFPILKSVYKSYSRKRLRKYSIPVNSDNAVGFNVGLIAGIKKDLDYFQYKMRNTECFFIQLDGFKMLIKLEGHLKIGTVAYFDSCRFDDFLAIVRKLAKRIGATKVIFLMSENYWLFDYFKNERSIEESLPIGFYRINEEIDCNLIAFTQSDYDTF